MWQAFVTGFAKQATEDIKERQKEIQDEIKLEMAKRAKESEEATKKADKERESRYSLARQLNAVMSGVSDMSEEDKKGRIAALIANPEMGKKFIEAVTEGRIGADALGSFVELPKVEPGVSKPRVLPDEIMEQFKPRPKAAAAEPDYSKVAGPFGLPMSGAATRARTSAMAQFGLTEEQARGVEFVPPAEDITGAKFNLQVFAEERKPKDVVTLEGQLADYAQSQGLSIEEARLTDRGKNIQAKIDGRVLLAAERKGTEEEKSRSASAIRQNIAARLRERFQPLEFDKILQWEPDQQGGGNYRVLIPNSEGARKYQKERIEEIKDYFSSAGLINSEGKIVGGRNAADALDAYAVVDYENMKVKSWRTSPLETKAPATSTAPARGETAAPPEPAATPSAAPAPAAAPATPAPKPAEAGRMSQSEKQQTIQNATNAVKAINQNKELSQGQKNGRISIIKDRLRAAGIDPKEAGL